MSALEKNFVTREKLFAESDRLKASGVEPSIRKLLRALGGSATTISGFLREWKARQGIQPPVAPEDIEIPASVIDAGKQAAGDIWQVCYVAAQNKIKAMTEQANQRVKEAESDRDQALVELAESEAELIDAQARAAELGREIASLRQAVTTGANTEAGLRATAEQMGRQIEAQATELQRVHSEHDHARQAHSAELARLAADFERQLAAHVDAAHSAQAETASLRTKLEHQTAALQQTMERERSVLTDLSKAEGEAARVTAQLDDAKAAAAQVESGLREQLANYRDQLAALTGQRQAAAGERDALRAQASDIETSLRDELAGLRDEVSSLTALRAAAAGERDALRAQVSSQLEVIVAFSNAHLGGAGAEAESGKATVSGRKAQKPEHTG